MENNDIYMKSSYEKASTIIKLTYEINEEKKIISIFNTNFVEKNKSKCKMIINNKLYDLIDKYIMSNKNTKELKIKLLIFNGEKINLSYMFYKCKSLKEFKILTKEENISEEEFSGENENNRYNMQNDYNLLYESEKINNIIDLNKPLSYSSIKSNNNSLSEYSSFYENSFYFNSWKINRINKNFSKKDNYDKDSIIATNMRYMFYECSSLLSITGLSKINTSNVKYMNCMFFKCSSLKKICDISNWNTEQVVRISQILYFRN